MGSKTYYTLAVKSEAGIWGAQFGDYSRDVVAQEMQDMLASDTAGGLSPAFFKPNYKTIKSGDSQAEIETAIAALNGVNPKPAPVTLATLDTSELDALPVEAPAPRVIDVTPTWESLIPAFVALIENGNATGRATAIHELKRLAAMGDSLVAEAKAGVIADYPMRADRGTAAGAIVLRHLPGNDATPYVVHFRNDADSERAGKPAYYYGDYCANLAEGWQAFADKIRRYDPTGALGAESAQ